jgi:hypothetical protein
MIRTLSIALLVAATTGTAACGSNGKAGPSVDEKAFKELTKGIHAGDAWAPTVASVEKLLGKAKVTTEQEWKWAVVDGDDCFDLDLDKNGDKVAGWGGGHVNKMLGNLFAKCAAKAK